MAFVIITHLTPHRKSLLDQIIRQFTDLPVHVAESGMMVEPDAVYVMPGNAILTITEGRLHLVAENPGRRERKPIDVFFSALAADQGERAVGIIMSGGDSDGTRGAKAIKGKGGFVLAQVADGEETGPGNPEMPQSAIANGLVDFAIPAEDMPARLLQLRSGAATLDERLREGDPEGDPAAIHAEIAALLRAKSGHDFQGYKSKTFFRRVARRMQVCAIRSLPAYVDLLRADADEVMALFRDLLIGVTGFFRDAEAFHALEEKVIPALVAEAGTGPIRAWVPGCATGEEVYSLAILLHEQLPHSATGAQLQIFATDIDEQAIQVARAAQYAEELLSQVSPERRERFFRREGTSFVVAKEVRETCIFSPHSLISDPPFSSMDLVSCRNLLIYLGHELQRQVIPTLHYALKPGGYLFLGTSESIGGREDLFAEVDKKDRIFRARAAPGTRARLPISVERMKAAPQRFDRPSPRQPRGPGDLRRTVERQLLERHVPAHVVIQRDGEVVHYSAGTGAYLEAPSGPPARHLLDLVRQELRMDLRVVLRAAMEGAPPVARHVRTEMPEAREDVCITVERLDRPREGSDLWMVLFTPVPRHAPPTGTEQAGRLAAEALLEQELRDLRETRRGLVEEYETALEELKSANEEMFSVNEDVQSTNEELQASREELQSLNEELGTVNVELNGKIDELSRVHADLRNLYEATQIATVFLDAGFLIRNFTPAASAFFKLRPSDIGRPLTELAGATEYPDLPAQIGQVFETGHMVEGRLAHAASAAHYLVRLIPYRDEGKITGVVVTFIDVTRLAEAEAQQNVLIAELNHRVKNMLALVVSLTHLSRKGAKSVSDFAEALLGRLHGMSHAHELLSMVAWKSAALRDLIQRETDLYGPQRIRAAGPDIALCPRATLSLSMVIHELSTNAVKHGALSAATGQVMVDWTEREGHLHFHWRERGGPAVSPPREEGFGMVLLCGQIVGELGGACDITFHPEGLEVTASFALAEGALPS